ncbi:MAG TPA: dephospho-CoA kinase [Kofleriaceae bacterium]|nr:dephospho-CoA kinase [Kofleriaceae bacterium]
MAKVIGLTGGIASGKSTVAALLTQLGAAVIDADVIARQVVEPGQPALAAIAARFGESVLDAGGGLDRARLAAIAFADDSARRDLNAIIHPRIAEASQRAIAAAVAAGHEIVIYDAALIVENGIHRGLDGLIVVAAPEAIQIQRIMARDGIDETAARARLRAQLPLAEKVAVADHVIDNGGDLEATRAQVRAVWKDIKGSP